LLSAEDSDQALSAGNIRTAEAIIGANDFMYGSFMWESTAKEFSSPKSLRQPYKTMKIAWDNSAFRAPIALAPVDFCSGKGHRLPCA
jgi:hypothetical protein